jgi:hypothetical protein
MTAATESRRLVRFVFAMVISGGAIGWILIGDLLGALGLWIAFGVGVLIMASIAEFMIGGEREP